MAERDRRDKRRLWLFLLIVGLLLVFILSGIAERTIHPRNHARKSVPTRIVFRPAPTVAMPPSPSGPELDASRFNITADDEEARLDPELIDGSGFPGTADYRTSESIELALLQRPGSLQGWVSDMRGLPLMGATVTLRYEEDVAGGVVPPEFTATTGDAGMFAFKKVPPGFWTASAVREGYARDVRPGIAILPDREADPVTLRLGAGLSIEGRVLAAGEPVANAVVRITQDQIVVHGEGNLVPLRVDFGNATTVADGFYSLPNLAPGDYLLSVMATGFARLEQIITLSTTSLQRDLKLDPEAIIAGKVRSGRGAIVKDASLAMYREAVVGIPYAETKSLGDGTFVFRQLPGGSTFTLTGSAPSHAPAAPQKVVAGTLNNVVTLDAGGAIEGLVTDLLTGHPVAGVGIVAWPEGRSTAQAMWTRTNSSGRYRVERLVGGSYALAVASETYTSEERGGIAVPPDGTIGGIDIAVYEGISINGIVVDRDTGDRLPGAMVTATLNAGGRGRRDPSPVVSDTAGTFKIRNLPQGPWKLTASCPGYLMEQAKSEGVVVQLVRTVPLPPVELGLVRGGVVEGLVVDANSHGIGQALVQLFAPAGKPVVPQVNGKRAVTDGEGRFRIEGIAVSTDIELIASAWAVGLPKGKSEPFALGRFSPVHEVRIVLSGGAPLAVTVTSRDGRAIEGAEVRLRHDAFGDDPPPPDWLRKTEQNGVALFPGIPPGELEVSASAPGYLPDTEFLTAEAGAASLGLSIRLNPARMLMGKVFDDRGEAVSEGYVTAEPESGATGSGSTRLGASGDFVIDTLGEGTFLVTVNTERPSATGSRNIAWGFRKVAPGGLGGALRFAVPINGSLTGRVLIPGVGEDDFPLFNVALQATYRDSAGIERIFTTAHTFATDGRFTFNGLPSGSYRVTASTDGYLPGTDGPFEVTSPNEVSIGTISVEGGGKLRCKVVEVESKRPLASAVAIITRTDQRAESNGEGVLEFASILPGLYDLRIERDGYIPEERTLLQIARNKTLDLGTVALRPGCEVHGFVTDRKGHGLAGVYVEARPSEGDAIARTTSLEDGSWSLRGLTPGGQDIHFSGEVDGRRAAHSESVNVRTEEPLELDVILDPSSSLRGALVASAITDVSRAIVTLIPLSGANTPLLAEAITGVDVGGSTFFADLLAQGRYLITVRAPRNDGSVNYFHGTTEIEEGSNETVVEGGQVTLAGRLLPSQEGGEDVGAQTVRLDLLSSPQSGLIALRNWWRWTVTSDAHGEFTFKELPPGTYSLTANREGTDDDVLEFVTLGRDQMVVRRDFRFK